MGALAGHWKPSAVSRAEISLIMFVRVSQSQLTVGLSLALLPVSGLGPVADAAVLVEPEAGGAGVLLCLAINTGVEDVTDSGVGVGVETIQAGTQVTGALGLLCRVRVRDYTGTRTRQSENLRSSSLSPQSTLK